ncbi:tRNA ligase [Tyrophagus putrescentiae]|nr:tRNA ligase [Tyrophagus putrescentiae]
MTTAFANHLKRTLGHLSPSTSYLTRNIGGSFCAVSQLTTTTFHHRQIHLSASVSFAVKSRRKQTPNLSKMFLFKPSTDNSDTYDPAKATSKYNAVKDAVWKSGEKVPFLALAKTFAAIEEHSGRLKSIEIMSNYFCSVMHLSPDDLVKSVYMCLNKVCPDYENIELGIGPGILHKALAESTGKTLAQVKKDIASLGDIGLYAEKSKSNQKLLVKPKPLTVSAVFDAFKTIAMMTGNQVQSKKVDKIKSLITSSSPIESRFIMRSLAGKMRIGLGEKSLLQALTQAYLIFKDESNAKLVGSDKFKEKLAKKSLLLQTAYSVAFDVSTKQILPFQVLSTRKRKNVDESEITVRVCLFAFDLLYLNSESLVTKDLSERRELLRQSFNEVEGKFMLATSKDLSDVDAIQEFLEESIKSKCEGLMIKTLHDDATYEIAKRSRKWLKLKKDYLEGVGDTLDLVPIGAYLGKGKRTGVYGGFLLACYDEESEEFQSICKIGTGFTDEDLSSLSASLKESLVAKPKSYFLFDDSLNPDVWFEPSQVWEVKCADLSISPVHRAGVGLLDDTKGISLRFPRFIKLREDKKPRGRDHGQPGGGHVPQPGECQVGGRRGGGGGTAGSKEDENDYY